MIAVALSLASDLLGLHGRYISDCWRPWVTYLNRAARHASHCIGQDLDAAWLASPGITGDDLLGSCIWC